MGYNSRMQKAFIYLTVALVGVGLMVLVSEYVIPAASGTVYKDAAAYNEALRAEIDAGAVPDMPSCAESISLSKDGDVTTAIDFICTDPAQRDTYIAYINEEYAWDIGVMDDDRVALRRQRED